MKQPKDELSPLKKSPSKPPPTLLEPRKLNMNPSIVQNNINNNKKDVSSSFAFANDDGSQLAKNIQPAKAKDEEDCLMCGS